MSEDLAEDIDALIRRANEAIEARADPWPWRNAQAIADVVFNPLLAEMGLPADMRCEFKAPSEPVTITYTPYDPDQVVELRREEHPRP